MTATRGSVLLPLSAMAAAMISVQFGAAWAKRLFPAVGAEGATALRVSIAAAMLLVMVRPWRRRPARGAWPALIGLGVALGTMNLLFYMALATIPLGVAVGLEFSGPLAVAVLSSRRWIDFMWIALALAGLVMLLPLRGVAQGLDPAGVTLALGAGVCWGLYILLGKAAGGIGGAQTAALATTVAALVVAPVGLAHAGAGLFDARLLPAACLVALFSSAIPYTLEMFALARMPTRVFGTLMSAEPAVAALMGLVLLHERLTLQQGVSIGAIIAASLGVTATMRRDRLVAADL